MSYLFSCLQRKDKDRQLALITIGYLSVCVGADIEKYLPKIIEYIRSTLPQTKVIPLQLNRSLKILNQFYFKGSVIDKEAFRFARRVCFRLPESSWSRHRAIAVGQ